MKAGRSKIHRRGILATEEIPAQRRVIEYTGEHIGLREAYRKRVKAHLYRIRTGKRRYVDGAIGGSGAECINHSREPNRVARVRKRRVMPVSLRRIEAGEELLPDDGVTGDAPLIPRRWDRCRHCRALPPAGREGGRPDKLP
ncbi:MAG: SET domain-containing protein [Bryobacteraceae bacterium]|nr:SET domain-containing protein [Bryobacteraceae bacterium]